MSSGACCCSTRTGYWRTSDGWVGSTAPARSGFFSNLAYFESFATLQHSREGFQLALREAHVLVLGTGGLNSNTIPHLCGLGVGRLTLLDQDAVEVRNFARQYLYRRRDIGARKVQVAADWVRAFDPDIKVEALDASVRGPEDVAELVDRFTPEVVMSGIDSPRGVDDRVNAGSVSRGVPYVRGGMYVTQGKIVSVDPGVSACRACDGPTSRPAAVEGGRLCQPRRYAIGGNPGARRNRTSTSIGDSGSPAA